MTDVDAYLRGEVLYGDDFTGADLEAWCASEEEGYSSILLSGKDYSIYPYHALNNRLFFRDFPVPEDAVVLGLGSALGHELLPIADRIASAIIVDPSEEMAQIHVLGDRPVSYVKPRVDGTIEANDAHFDIITCFGVLHHIANVSTVMTECARVLKPGGLMFTREPIVTQGDWRKPRPGLTPNERGIPLQKFHAIAKLAGFRIERSTLCDFSPFLRVMARMGKPVFSSTLMTGLDLMLARLFAFNTLYHRPGFLQKFGPASVGLVLRKPGNRA